MTVALAEQSLDLRSLVGRQPGQTELGTAGGGRCQRGSGLLVAVQRGQASGEQQGRSQRGERPSRGVDALEECAGPRARRLALLVGGAGEQQPDRGVFLDLRDHRRDAAVLGDRARPQDLLGVDEFGVDAQADSLIGDPCAQARQYEVRHRLLPGGEPLRRGCAVAESGLDPCADDVSGDHEVDAPARGAELVALVEQPGGLVEFAGLVAQLAE